MSKPLLLAAVILFVVAAFIVAPAWGAPLFWLMVGLACLAASGLA